MVGNRQKDLIFVGIQLLLFLAYVLEIECYSFNIPNSIQYGSLFLLAIAMLLGILAVLQLNKSLSPFPTPKENGRLITSGVFKLSRHPIYTAIILAGLSYGIYQTSVYKISIGLLLWLLFYFKSSYEEQLLVQRFPEYSAYQTKVGRFFPKLF